MREPKILRREASEDRRQAEEAAERNPMYSDYLYHRADWKGYLARQEEEFLSMEAAER